MLNRILGRDGSTQWSLDAYNFAGRVSQRPMPVGSRGAYSLNLLTGLLPAGLGTNSEIAQFRFTTSVAGVLGLLRGIWISASTSTTMFAAGVPVQIETRHARGWTAQGTGGTAITFGANDCKKSTNFGTSVIGSGDVRIATTTGLGAGTKTLDGNAFGGAMAGGPITASLNGTIFQNTPLWQRNTGDEWPIRYVNQEGFVVRSVAVPGTGTWMASITIEWCEIDPSVALTDGWG